MVALVMRTLALVIAVAWATWPAAAAPAVALNLSTSVAPVATPVTFRKWRGDGYYGYSGPRYYGYSGSRYYEYSGGRYYGYSGGRYYGYSGATSSWPPPVRYYSGPALRYAPPTAYYPPPVPSWSDWYYYNDFAAPRGGRGY